MEHRQLVHGASCPLVFGVSMGPYTKRDALKTQAARSLRVLLSCDGCLDVTTHTWGRLPNRLPLPRRRIRWRRIRRTSHRQPRWSRCLRTSGNPKFANSQFVSFIDKVSKGDLQFKDNTVVNREGQEVDWILCTTLQLRQPLTPTGRSLISSGKQLAALSLAWRTRGHKLTGRLLRNSGKVRVQREWRTSGEWPRRKACKTSRTWGRGGARFPSELLSYPVVVLVCVATLNGRSLIYRCSQVPSAVHKMGLPLIIESVGLGAHGPGVTRNLLHVYQSRCERAAWIFDGYVVRRRCSCVPNFFAYFEQYL